MKAIPTSAKEPEVRESQLRKIEEKRARDFGMVLDSLWRKP